MAQNVGSITTYILYSMHFQREGLALTAGLMLRDIDYMHPVNFLTANGTFLWPISITVSNNNKPGQIEVTQGCS